MRDLRVTLVQTLLHWEDAEANRNMLGGTLAQCRGATDLVVLPEMFTTGFSMNTQHLAETMTGPTIAWMREQARTLDAALYGSAIITEHGHCFNRGLFVTPDGEVAVYDKRHLFRHAGEEKHYRPGHDRVVVAWRGWRFLLQICYDLRFPVFSRSRGDYDALLYVANWPEPRRHPWRQLLMARAIENQAWVIGVNRVGMDGKGIHYSGDSAVVDPKGLAMEAPPGIGLLHHVLSAKDLIDLRAKFPVALDADDFEMEL